MKFSKIVCAIAAASLGCAGVAVAQGNPPNTERAAPQSTRPEASPRDSARQQRPAASRNTRPVAQYNRGDDRSRGDDRHGGDSNNWHGDRRGAGPDHNFYRGGHLPRQYRDRQYVVEDWRGHHLSAPPRGYHWVQAGGDYVLAAIATGVIASILLNSGN